MPKQSEKPVAQIQLKKQFFSKVFLGLVLVGLSILGLLKLKDIFYKPILEIEYHPFGLEVEEQLTRGAHPELLEDDLEEFSEVDQGRYKKALLQFKTGDPSSAFETCQQIEPLYPKNTSLLNLYSQSAIASEQEPEVLLEIRKKIHKYLQDNQHPLISLNKALIDEKIESPEEARKTLHSILQESPQFARAYFELARMEMNAKEFSLARRSLQYAISLDPRTREGAYAMLSQLYHDQGQLDSLKVLLQLTLNNFPYNAEFNLLQGYLKEYQSDLEEAGLIYKRMIQVHPEDDRFTDALETIGYKEAPKGAFLKSNQQLKPVIQVIASIYEGDSENSGLAYAYYKLLKLGHQPEQIDQAKAIQAKFISLYPNDPRWNPNSRSSIADIQPIEDSSPDDSLLQLAQSGFQSTKSGNTGRRNWDVVGHYLVNWGSSQKEFKEAYSDFTLTQIDTKQDTTVYQEEYLDELANYQYTLIYNKDQLDRILIKIEEAQDNSDILGEMIHKLVGISGKPTKIRQNSCRGFKKFQAYHWASQDNFEILLQFDGKPHQARLLRLNPQKVNLPFDLCQSLPYILDWKGKKVIVQ